MPYRTVFNSTDRRQKVLKKENTFCSTNRNGILTIQSGFFALDSTKQLYRNTERDLLKQNVWIHDSLCASVCVRVHDIEDAIAEDVQMSEQCVMSNLALSFHGTMWWRCD